MTPLRQADLLALALVVAAVSLFFGVVASVASPAPDRDQFPDGLPVFHR